MSDYLVENLFRPVTNAGRVNNPPRQVASNGLALRSPPPSPVEGKRWGVNSARCGVLACEETGGIILDIEGDELCSETGLLPPPITTTGEPTSPRGEVAVVVRDTTGKALAEAPGELILEVEDPDIELGEVLSGPLLTLDVVEAIASDVLEEELSWLLVEEIAEDVLVELDDSECEVVPEGVEDRDSTLLEELEDLAAVEAVVSPGTQSGSPRVHPRGFGLGLPGGSQFFPCSSPLLPLVSQPWVFMFVEKVSIELP